MEADQERPKGPLPGDRAGRAAQLVEEALAGRADRAQRLLDADPSLAAPARAAPPGHAPVPPDELAVALALGDHDTVAAALAGDPQLVHRELPGVGRRPLSIACHSAFLARDQPRAEGVRRVVELLVDAGADPNETLLVGVAADRDIDDLFRRTADAALAVRDALL